MTQGLICWRWLCLPCYSLVLVLSFCSTSALIAQTNQTTNPSGTNDLLVMIQGKVEVAPAGTVNWSPGRLNQVLRPGDHVRTGERSRAAVYLSNGMTIEKGELSEVEIPPSAGSTFLKGLFKIFNREGAGKSTFKLPGATAAVRGTDFLVQISQEGNFDLTVLDGQVVISNSAGTVDVHNNERGSVVNGNAPTKTAVLEVPNDLIQWSLYYPGVLDVDELRLAEDEIQSLAQSLNAYRSGALPLAASAYPWHLSPVSDAGKAFQAALLLSVGQLQQATNLLQAIPGSSPFAQALEKLIAAVKFQPFPSTLTSHPSTSSEWLAESYYQQSLFKLQEALDAALAATTNAPKFGFAWQRVAELQFSFGRTDKALAALERSLQLSPRNAQAVSLKGFLLAAQNRISAAISQFDQAIEIDSALGNAWLGHGLCLIRQGHREEGLRDLLVAASLESQRSLLRSYLGKAFADTGDDDHATKELVLSKQLDRNDPTGWLYSALLKQQQNRINEAISDLEASQERNDNRSLFRSRLLLDEDRAVRSANLASIYRDAGMTEVSLREAARAVTYDYANDSAHLFLSDSYNELRDPTRFNLRYETVWFNELLLANLLSPIGAGRLSQHLSQQEYSRLFEADGLGLANSTRGRSDEKSVTELASQFGTFGRTSYSLDLDYETKKGVRPNNDLDVIEWYTTVKQQLSSQDTLLALVKYEDYHSGDNFQYYYPANSARRHFRFDEYQHPIVVGGWHHEWSPGMHTLILGGRLENEQFFSDRQAPQLLLEPTTPYGVDSVPFDVRYHGTLEIYTAELNQIFQWNRLSLSLGARYQFGTFQTSAQLFNPGRLQLFFNGTPTNTTASEDFDRITGYAYLTAEPLEHLWLTAGLAYDDITYPSNFRNPPISSGQDHRSQVGPKAALVWEVNPQATVRGVFTRSLGGVSLDESYRLEPTQLAGFPQTFRSLISESVVGSVAAPEYQTFGLALDLKLPCQTYAGIQLEGLETDIDRTIGVFVPTSVSGPGFSFPFLPSSTPESLHYRENSILVSLNKLVGTDFVVGANYKFADVELHDVLPRVPVSALPSADQTSNPKLHQASTYLLFNHSSGFFARFEGQWYHQSSSTLLYYGTHVSGDDFFQENIFAGYRFAHRRVELLLGILNLSDQDYHLNPLTVYAELPRERTFIGRLKFQF